MKKIILSLAVLGIGSFSTAFAAGTCVEISPNSFVVNPVAVLPKTVTSVDANGVVTVSTGDSVMVSWGPDLVPFVKAVSNVAGKLVATWGPDMVASLSCQ